MKTIVYLSVLFALSTVVCVGDEKPKLAISSTNELAAIRQEFEDTKTAYHKATEALPETSEGERKASELWKTFNNKQSDLFMAVVELAKVEPKSNVGFAALEWLLTDPGPGAYGKPAGKLAMELVTSCHAGNPKVGKITAWVGYYMPIEKNASYPAAIALIQAVAERNPDRTARGQAMMAIAWQEGKKFARAESTKSADVDAIAIEAERAFEAVIKDYADCPRLMRDGQPNLGDEAKQELFELRNLRVGKVAPDIKGQDLDGADFKLSDYRGQVTAVVFWATWCGPCMQMVPHERKLVERMKDQPFKLIGVNGDEDRDKARKVTAREAMTWRSFWNGPKGSDGPISHAWNVRGWPTVYVLDNRGVIRAKEVFGDDLDAMVDQLVKELAPKDN